MSTKKSGKAKVEVTSEPAKVEPVTKKVTKKEATTKGEPSVRERVFKLLSKNPDGLGGAAIMKALGLAGIPSLLKDEGVSSKPRIKRAKVEGQLGVVYSLTALGEKDLEQGIVDENAAERSSNQEWPAGR